MKKTLNISKAVLVSVVDSVLNPNPDDSGQSHGPFGPWGPGGPVTSNLLWALLNPQPLPPGPPDPWLSKLAWVLLNPQPLPPGPDPYRAALLAHTMVSRAFEQYQFAEVLGAGKERSAGGARVIGSQLSKFIDEYCGTPPRHGPKPPRPFDFLVAGAQFQKAADSSPDHPLQEHFSSAADKLFETGLRQMEKEGRQAQT